MKKWMSYTVVILWLTAAVRYIAAEEAGDAWVVQALAEADFVEMEGSLCVSGRLRGEVADRAAFLQEIAAQLGLYTGYTIQEDVRGAQHVTTLVKEMPQAQVRMQLMTAGEAGYLQVELDIYQCAASALYYKKKLEQISETYTEAGEVVLLMKGVLAGYLSQDERNTAAKRLLAQMDAVVQEEHQEDGLHTVYAYTKKGAAAKRVNGKEVNVNIAFVYDEYRDRTLVYLGSPLIVENY